MEKGRPAILRSVGLVKISTFRPHSKIRLFPRGFSGKLCADVLVVCYCIVLVHDPDRNF